MKIEYDQHNYEIIKTVETPTLTFQTVKFPNNHYGIKIIVPEENISDIMLISTNKSETYTNLFIESVREQTETINKIYDEIDSVVLKVELNSKQSKVFEEVISKEQANDLLERMRITNEIMDMRNEERASVNAVVTICMIIMIAMTILSILRVWRVI